MTDSAMATAGHRRPVLQVRHVVMFDWPSSAADFVHRAGRASRVHGSLATRMHGQLLWRKPLPRHWCSLPRMLVVIRPFTHPAHNSRGSIECVEVELVFGRRVSESGYHTDSQSFRHDHQSSRSWGAARDKLNKITAPHAKQHSCTLCHVSPGARCTTIAGRVTCLVKPGHQSVMARQVREIALSD